MRMDICKTISAAAAAFAFMAVTAAAQDAEVSIPVNVTVQSFVEIEVIDTDGVNWDVTGTGPTGGDMGMHTGEHAKFRVTANASHTLTMTSSNGTWEASALLAPPWDTYRQVKYLRADDSGKFIGGGLYLRPVSSTAGGQEFQYWDGDNGQVELTGQAAGIHVWGVACVAMAELTGNADNPNGIVDGIAEPGLYQTDAVITAAVE